MSFKPSKKTLIKLSAPASNSHDKAGDPAVSIPSSHDGRSRKSFFSFRPTTKRHHVCSAAGHERAGNSNAMVQFPLANAKNGPNQLASSNSPPQLPLPTRTLRSSILFSQQFDLNNLSSTDDPLLRDPSPTTGLLANTTSRPLRSTTRPSSWMMLKDGSYAPPLKAQAQCPPNVQHSPESFYNSSPTRLPQRIDSSDDDGCSPASAASWDRLRSVPNDQQASHLKNVLVGYQLQVQTQDPPLPSRTKSQAVSRPAPKPAVNSCTSNIPRAPVTPLKSSDYSPLAAFLGQSKSASPVAPSSPPPPPVAAPGGLLSAFLGSQPSEHPPKIKSSAPLSPVSPAPQSSPRSTRYSSVPETQKAQLAHPSARLKESPRLEKQSGAVEPPAEKNEQVIKPTSNSSPIFNSFIPRRPPPQLASGPTVSSPTSVGVIDATGTYAIGTDRASAREKLKLEAAPSSLIPSPSRGSLATSNSSSPRSTTCYTPSNPSPPVLEKLPKAIARNSPTSDSGLCDPSQSSGSFQNGRSRKRSVEKVYLDSSSQHSSLCSDNFSSVDDALRKRAIGSDLSGVLTDPSSTCSYSSSASEKTPESVKGKIEEPEVHPLDSKEVDCAQQCALEVKCASTDIEKSTTEVASDHVEEEVEAGDETTRQPTINFEHLLLRHPEILRKVLSHLDYLDFFSLSQITGDFLEELEGDPRLREIVLKRYLAGFGYRSLSTRFTSGPNRRELPMISFDDLANFHAGLEFDSLELIEFSKQALNRRGLDYRTAKMIRSSTRAHNKLVAYVRVVEELSPSPANRKLVPRRHAGRLVEPVYRAGKAPIFKVWVPSADHWMTNDELAECERELWRSQIWSYLRKGDVCWNLAIGDFANEGKLLFDGRFLRDLLFDFDEVGHLPSWLDMLEFSPSYYHKIISSSTSTPIFYLDLSLHKDEIKKNLKLSEDKVEVASPQARYRVQRWVYRSIITISAGEWRGYIVIEVEGTSEQARDLLKRCCNGTGGTKNLTPWRIIREKSRPGKLWIRPVNDDEKIS